MSESEHILVVEDEEHLATGIKYNLVAEGYRVTTVGDGPSALRI
jgi:two-component system OmpR family response regulator